MIDERTRTNGGALHHTVQGGGIKAAALRALIATSGGAGFAVVYLLYDLLRGNPALLENALSSWGPNFVLMVGLMVMGHSYATRQQRFAEQQLTVARDAAAASGQQAEALRGLTGAVQQLVEKDDRRAQATEAAVGFVAQQNEQILGGLSELKHELEARWPKP